MEVVENVWSEQNQNLTLFSVLWPQDVDLARHDDSVGEKIRPNSNTLWLNEHALTEDILNQVWQTTNKVQTMTVSKTDDSSSQKF